MTQTPTGNPSEPQQPIVTDGTVAVPADGPPVQSLVQPTPQAKPDKGGFYWGTGRRKTAVARVRIKPGKGKFTINRHEAAKYFTEERDRANVLAPLKVTKTEGNLDVHVNVRGGGFMGQAGAVLLGLSRALKAYDPTLEPVLRENEFLTRDAREVERKKYGQRGARRRFQFSKR